MRITAITKYKNGDILGAIESLGWSQGELARKAGITRARVDKAINLQNRPTEDTANRIQAALAEAGVYFDPLASWPKGFQGLGRGVEKRETVDVPMESLLECKEAFLIPYDNESCDFDLLEKMESAMDSLTDKEKQVLRARFFDGQTLDEASKAIGGTRERIRQIESRAIRKLRHPSRAKFIQEFVDV